jgi:hypothetical protein
MSPGSSTITATDATTHAAGQATLLQAKSGSQTFLTSTPTSAVTNQRVTLAATVTSKSAAPAGAIAFLDKGAPISGCGAVPVSTSNPTVTCQTAFSAGTSPEQLTAKFTAAPGVSIAESTSAPVNLVVSKATTGTSLAVSSQFVNPGQTVTFTATVTANQSGAVVPSGSVQFLDGGFVLAACGSQPLDGSGSATCNFRYTDLGQHSITARYSGDANFGASSSSPAQSVDVTNAAQKILGRINSTMLWSFYFAPSFTKALRLFINHVPFGASILLTCHGRGCPFAHHKVSVRRPKGCRASRSRCHSRRFTSLDVAGALHGRGLRVGTKLTIEIFRPHWIAKLYIFKFRSSQLPRVVITCLSPGHNKPGVGC